jgi:hypothetical protein
MLGVYINGKENNNMNGKGSKPRPFSIKLNEFNDRWEAAFGKKKKSQPPTKTLPEPTAIDDRQLLPDM